MHCGPEPTEYGFDESDTGCNCPVDVLIVNAEIVLFVFELFVVDPFSTYRYLPRESVNELVGFDVSARLLTAPPVSVFRAQLVPTVYWRI
jgi:hypothetical protein